MINNNPLVSIIIPVYNCEKYVERAIRSIMNQTYENMEIIITDDCSTDRSYEILKSLADEDRRIVLKRNETNLKIVKTLNNMIDISNGKYIGRMDADDISNELRIQEQVRFLEENENIALCGVSAYLINENEKVIGYSNLPDTSDQVDIVKRFINPFYHPTVLVRAEVYKNNKYDINYQYAEDYELWLRILKTYKGVNLQQYLFSYRILKSSISHVSETAIKQKQLVESLQDFKMTDLKKIKNDVIRGNICYTLKNQYRGFSKILFLLKNSYFIFVFVFTYKVLAKIRNFGIS